MQQPHNNHDDNVELTIDDENESVIVLSHLQKCRIVKKVVINHKLGYTESDDDDDVSALSSDSDSSSDSDESTLCLDEEDDVEYAASLYHYRHLSPTECNDLFNTCIHVMEEYVLGHPTKFTDPNFHDIFESNVHAMVYANLTDDLFTGGGSTNSVKAELNHLIETAAKQFFQTYVPCRSHPDTRILSFAKDKKSVASKKKALTKQINVLRGKPQPAQRTPEWYDFRNNLITASNAYKVWESQKMQNSLIYEKCVAVAADAEQRAKSSSMFTNVESPLHWGQKYEPMSVLIYEDMYKTAVEDFGCIRHDTYFCVGASPDGINVDPKSDRYGRMLEIKNIVNRVINGIPKKEYWVQMQLQMEVCGLDECDFLETRFTEYEGYADYMAKKDDDYDYKGLMLYFVDPQEAGKPIYEYCPVLSNSVQDIEAWEEKVKAQREADGFRWVRNIYWKLAEFSCVLVCRNRVWFDNCVQNIQTLWKTVEEERVTGYAHREPTRRVKADGTPVTRVKKNELTPNKCFIKVTKMN